MKKLELKHIAPYLPYKLILAKEGFPHVEMQSINIHTDYSYWKPILRPLSDLSKAKLFDNYGDEKLTAIEEFEGNWDLSPLDWVLLEVSKGKQLERLLELNYLVIEELIKYHFDVFCLIDQGLAIDINTINENEQKKSRCCGRCDGVNDICVTDIICDSHSITGCEICFGTR